MGFLGFALKTVDILAWPLLSLGYPLCASIRAIESNSYSDMQKLITYWILFSLFSLMELGISGLIKWIPFWPYIKLMAICWLVLPCFDGACHVYENLIHPCFYVNPLDIIGQFKQPNDFFHSPENFLAMAQRYVAENGSEALEKLIVSKSKDVKPGSNMEEMNAIAIKEKIETASAIQLNSGAPVQAYVERKTLADLDIKEMIAVTNPERSSRNKDERGKCKDVDVQKDLKAVEPTSTVSTAAVKVDSEGQDVTHSEKHIVPAVATTEITGASVACGVNRLQEKSNLKQVVREKSKDPNVVQTGIKAVEPMERNTAAAAKVNWGGTNLTGVEKKTDAAMTSKETTAASVLGRPPETKKVQKEWTCAICQVTVQSEITLKSHLSGSRHRENCEMLKASNQTERRRMKQDKSNQANKQQEKCGLGSENSGKQKNQKNNADKPKQFKYWCNLCGVRCPSEIDLISHFSGRKHLSQVQAMAGNVGGTNP